MNRGTTGGDDVDDGGGGGGGGVSSSSGGGGGGGDATAWSSESRARSRVWCDAGDAGVVR